MSGQLQFLLVFLLVYADITYSKSYYITPSPDDPCPQHSSCLTLSQFAANSSYNETDISLLFLPGNHTLDRELILAQVKNFTMKKDGLDNETVFVECSTLSGRFHISETIYVLIYDLYIIGCGSNNISQVNYLTITDSTFQGIQESYSVLILNKVFTATIVRSSFLLNSLYYSIIRKPFVYKYEILDYIYFQGNTTSGVLYIAFSNISIISSKFMHNRADNGGAMVAYDSSIYLVRNSYINNTANYGGVMVTFGSMIDIDNSTFNNNAAKQGGGVMMTNNDIFTISSTTFTNNSADMDGGQGGVMETFGDSSFTIRNSIFINNGAKEGGVMYTVDYSSFTISNSTFNNNSADGGGVMQTFDYSSFNISNSTFNDNSALEGGVMLISGYSSFNISNNTFNNNTADDGGVVWTSGYSSFTISNSTFNNNSAVDGGVVYTFKYPSSLNIINSVFTNNKATQNGGVIFTLIGSSLTVGNSTFANNKAIINGGVIWCYGGSAYVIDNSSFNSNAASRQGGGVIFSVQCDINIASSNFIQNNGSIYAYSSPLTFSGDLKFDNCSEPVIPGNGTQEGGAITSFQSTVTFNIGSIAHFSNNQANHGGAILATESTIKLYGQTTIVNSMANSIGGAISLKQSSLHIYAKCQIINNVAAMGGGIHATSSTIAVLQTGSLLVSNNTAQLGGGMYLEVNPKLYIMKNTPIKITVYLMNLTRNHAYYGGAVYVADDTNSGACSPDNECFLQTLALHQVTTYWINTENILFHANTASEQGPNLFGGLLDRCIPSPFAELYRKQSKHDGGVTYIESVSNIDLYSVSSQPVRVCFCNSEHEPDCSYQPPIVRVQKGKEFNVSVAAVDQVNHTVDAKITATLSLSDGGFAEGQTTQSVKRNCTDVTFNVFSPHSFETIKFHPDGPCGNATLSTRNLTIQFIDCTCPVGFTNTKSLTKCECVCDSALSPYITKCNITTSSVIRNDTNSWITYINDTDPPGYIIYPNCPFDYCQPQTENVTVNFNLLSGADSQCAYIHSGILCGACNENLSLSLASSRCVHCHAYWPAVSAVIILAAAIAGILLVTALLALNMTVSVGLINGFIFYANIVSAGSTVFLPPSEPSFSSVFIAWLNLDIGIDVCFIDGLDAYTKTWIQLAFPLYLISLVVIVIIVSEYSPRFSRLIGKRDPISTLATLILLSYAKLLSMTITALSFAILDYPDGHQETVWLPDGNVPYFQRKHIPLVVLAVIIIIIGLPYTIILFLWQWIVRAPRWKIFNWTRSTKLYAFIDSHHVPHNSKHRYWTGLLLLVRVVLYITASVTDSANPETMPIIIIILLGCLFLLKNIFAIRVYKEAFVDIVDTMLYVNLLVLSAFSVYGFKANIVMQTAVAYTCTIVTFILFVGAICYHVNLLIVKKRSISSEDDNEPLLSPVKASNSEVTRSVIERPKPDQGPTLTDQENSDWNDITEDRHNVTPPYS